MLFLAHMIFGDGGWGVAFLLALLISGSLMFLVWRSSLLHFGRFRQQAIVVVSTLTFGVRLLLHSDSSLALLQFHATEIPTWGLTIAACALLLPKTDRRRIMLASGLLGLVFITRPNHLFALLVVLGLLIVANRRELRQWRTVPSILGPFVAVSLLPVVHNVVYGGEFKILPTGSETVRDLTVGQVLTAPGDSAVMRVLSQKIGLFFNQSDVASAGATLSWPILIFGVLWLFGVISVALRRRTSGVLWGLAVVPIGYLTTMVLYDVLIYYPRHVVAFNFALGLCGATVALFSFGPSTEAAPETKVARATTTRPSQGKKRR